MAASCAGNDMFRRQNVSTCVPILPLLIVVQVLHEELMYANFVNPFRPGDAMTSLTYIHRVEQHPNGERVVPIEISVSTKQGFIGGYPIAGLRVATRRGFAGNVLTMPLIS